MKIAAVFSGQGAQKAGMGKSFYESSKAAKDILDSIPSRTLEYCFSGSDEELSRTEITQPCLYAVSCAGAAALNEAFAKNGLEISLAAGFSLGEYSALCFGGVFSFSDGFEIVSNRGRWMAEAAGDGKSGMAAVIGTIDKINEAVDYASDAGMILPVNYNSPKQTVVAGENAALAKFTEKASEMGLRVVPLSVSGAFHSPLMSGAADKLKDLLSKYQLNSPRIPIYSNVTAKPFEKDELAEQISRQTKSPVKWEETVRNMINDGADIFIEIGAGSTLCGLIRRIDKSVTTYCAENMDGLKEAVAAITAHS